MLVLSRKIGEEIIIDGDIRLVVLKVKGDKVRIGISAPEAVHIVRSEIMNVQRPENCNDSSVSV